MAALPPAQPTAIMRGHRAQVHAAVFLRLGGTGTEGSPDDGSCMTADSRLATGDSDGYVVLWDLAIVRARAVWRAHRNSILGLAAWDADSQVVTHGRDHKLVVWQVGVADEARLSTSLPLDGELESSSEHDHPQPWIVHVLDVNTMNFCAFAWCGLSGALGVSAVSAVPVGDGSATTTSPTERLVAVPNALTLEAADIYHLPSQRRINTIRLGAKEGMIMALALFYTPITPSERGRLDSADDQTLVLIAAFENGVAVVAALAAPDGPATLRYRAQPHSQPILSLDVAPDQSYFLTSSADAVLAKHPIRVQPAKQVQDATTTITSPPPETSTVAREGPPPQSLPTTATAKKPVSLLSAALAKEASSSSSLSSYSKLHPTVSLEPPPIETQPLAVVNTKHAGQQGLRIRSDGRLFATAGWDARVRVYAAQTMKEVAVLKWHQTGCFAVAFAPVAGTGSTEGVGSSSVNDGGHKETSTNTTSPSSDTTSLVPRPAARREVSVKERRLRHAVTAHWLVAGSKDGKISLWDIF